MRELLQQSAYRAQKYTLHYPPTPTANRVVQSTMFNRKECTFFVPN